MSILIYPDIYRDLQSIRYLDNIPILVRALSDESQNYGISWVRRDPQGPSSPPFGLVQDSLKNHIVCWFWPMTLLFSRRFSIPHRIIFSMILWDTEVRLTGLQLPAQLSCPSWKLWQCLPASSQQGFPKPFKNHWERFLMTQTGLWVPWDGSSQAP